MWCYSTPIPHRYFTNGPAGNTSSGLHPGCICRRAISISVLGHQYRSLSGVSLTAAKAMSKFRPCSAFPGSLARATNRCAVSCLKAEMVSSMLWRIQGEILIRRPSNVVDPPTLGSLGSSMANSGVYRHQQGHLPATMPKAKGA